MIIVQVSVLEAQLKATVGEVKYLSSLLYQCSATSYFIRFLFQFHDLCRPKYGREKLFHNTVWFLQIFRICYLDLMICVDQNTDFKYLSFSFSLQCIALQHSVPSDIKKEISEIFYFNFMICVDQNMKKKFRFLRTELSSSQLDLLSSRSEVVVLYFCICVCLHLYLCLSSFVFVPVFICICVCLHLYLCLHLYFICLVNILSLRITSLDVLTLWQF